MKKGLDMRVYTKADDAESYSAGAGTKYGVQLKDEEGNPYPLLYMKLR